MAGSPRVLRWRWPGSIDVGMRLCPMETTPRIVIARLSCSPHSGAAPLADLSVPGVGASRGWCCQRGADRCEAAGVFRVAEANDLGGDRELRWGAEFDAGGACRGRTVRGVPALVRIEVDQEGEHPIDLLDGGHDDLEHDIPRGLAQVSGEGLSRNRPILHILAGIVHPVTEVVAGGRYGNDADLGSLRFRLGLDDNRIRHGSDEIRRAGHRHAGPPESIGLPYRRTQCPCVVDRGGSARPPGLERAGRRQHLPGPPLRPMGLLRPDGRASVGDHRLAPPYRLFPRGKVTQMVWGTWADLGVDLDPAPQVIEQEGHRLVGDRRASARRLPAVWVCPPERPDTSPFSNTCSPCTFSHYPPGTVGRWVVAGSGGRLVVTPVGKIERVGMTAWRH